MFAMKLRILFTCITVALTVFSSSSQIIRSFVEKDQISCFTYTPDGRLLVTAVDNNLKVWNLETGQLINAFNVGSKAQTIALDANGLMLVCASGNNDLKLWDISVGRGVPFKNTHNDRIMSLALNANGTILATGSKDKTIKLWNLKTYSELATLKGHKAGVTNLIFSNDGKFLISSSDDNTIKLWNTETNAELITYAAHSDGVRALAISPDNKIIASGGKDACILLWDIEKGDAPLHRIADNASFNGLAFSADGKFLACCKEAPFFSIYSMKDIRQISVRIGTGVNHVRNIKQLGFTNDGKLLTLGEDKMLKYWNWGFPTLSAVDLQMQDANSNGSIEGTEQATLAFKIVNSGYGEALRVKFTINEINKISNLSYQSTFDIGDLKPKSEYAVNIPIKTTKSLIDSVAVFRIESITTISYMPIPPDTSLIAVRTVSIPVLKIESATYSDTDLNDTLNGRGEGRIVVQIKNSGAGTAKGVKAVITCNRADSEIEYANELYIGEILQDNTKELRIPLQASKLLTDGKALFRIDITEDKLISNDMTEVTVKTQKYSPTVKEEIKEYVEDQINDWQKKGKYEKTDDFKKRVTEQTRQKQIEVFTQVAIDTIAHRSLNWSSAMNEYDADNESFKITLPNFIPFYIKIPINQAENFDKNFGLFTYSNAKYTVAENQLALLHIELTNSKDSLSPAYIYDSKDIVAFNSTQLDFNFDPISVDLTGGNVNNQNVSTTKVLKVGKSDVDMNIPETTVKNPRIYALVIGNEDYSSYQSGLNNEVNVDYAANDARIFKEYLVKTYGVPEENITLRINATLGQMKQSILKLSKLAELSNGSAELIFYYSGHGLPDENTKEGYLMPVDITGTEIKSAVNLGDLYKQLTQFPVKKATVVLDACFSGGARNQPLVSLKGVKIKTREEDISGNLVILTSSSGDESSAVFSDKQHGLFTYFLLQKCQETQGNVDYNTLIEYVSEKVKLQSVLINNKVQTPQIMVSPDVLNTYQTLKFLGE